MPLGRYETQLGLGVVIYLAGILGHRFMVLYEAVHAPLWLRCVLGVPHRVQISYRSALYQMWGVLQVIVAGLGMAHVVRGVLWAGLTVGAMVVTVVLTLVFDARFTKRHKGR